MISIFGQAANLNHRHGAYYRDTAKVLLGTCITLSEGTVMRGQSCGMQRPHSRPAVRVRPYQVLDLQGFPTHGTVRGPEPFSNWVVPMPVNGFTRDPCLNQCGGFSHGIALKLASPPTTGIPMGGGPAFCAGCD